MAGSLDRQKEHLPDGNLEICEENLHDFWYWIHERHKIYVKRFLKKKEAPWTKDPILSEYKFTNVYRELDRFSVWLIKNVCRSDKFPDLKSKLFALLICRMFCKSETFDELGIPDYRIFSAKKFTKGLKRIVERGENPFTNAYLINSSSYAGIRKYEAYGIHVSGFIHKNMDLFFKTIVFADSPKDIIKVLKTINGVSDFISYEFYCDLDYCSPKLMKFDQNDFVSIGPGALAGSRLIFPKEVEEKGRKVCLDIIHRLRDGQEDYFKRYGFNFKFLDNKYGRLSLREIEHSLCEYQKFWKMRKGIGKQRMKFTPITEV